ncbi:uncharacterized protein N7496_011918 [Penicillium cataractarum]|uniref:Uncharacterized protein n=1 Tax=Penicillium cataractarum TaxID=2100454 RepID=A0A9W9RH82_9EURO|nr:uncharacterized protein N7496_011918 [Penicillium cataractarum]KAJ5359505.1 hypothetical protein N7496_011918 [Penicillium cataractarum]
MSCPPQISRPEVSDSSDYGSDFTPDEEELLNELVTTAAAEHATVQRDATPVSTPTPNHISEDTITTPVAATLEDLDSLQPATIAALVADIEDAVTNAPGVRLPKVLGREKPGSPWRRSSQRLWPGPTSPRSPMASQGSNNSRSQIVEHPGSTEGRERERERSAVRELEWTRETQLAPTLETRTPVERFRRPPNKAFSVTDLVSPAWCELQYWYTLTKHGRKRRTPAMKKGSVVHKTLEDEIYTTVPVEIKTKEDAWALRIWNVIQGLRMLREYGITRELEIWGVVDGELVNGVIDQLSYECPDSELEATAAGYYEDAGKSRAALPEYQMSLSDFLLSSAQGGKRISDLADLGAPGEVPPPIEDNPAVYGLPRIYMTDVKTKAGGSVPTVKSTSFRPTLLQLQLYYHMLSRLITSDDVTMDVLAARYNLDPEKPFTDAFISEVGGLNDEFFDAVSSQEFDLDDVPTPEEAVQASHGFGPASSPPHASQDSTSILLTHGTLHRLWRYMKEQLRLTFIPTFSPHEESVAPSIPSLTQPTMLEDYPTLLSPVLTARFLSSAPTTDLHPKLLGSRSFLFDPNTMSSYLTDQMEWWRGQRNPQGVGIVEAWKCRICEFRDECSWRQERELDYATRNRRRRAGSLADI